VDKKHLILIGLAVTLGVVIVYYSTRKPALIEITEIEEQKNFDNSTLPSRLQPPYKMAEGDPMPQRFASQRILGLNAKPRFDAY